MVSLSTRTTCYGPEHSESQVDQLSITLSANATVKSARGLPLWGNSSEIIVSFLDGFQHQKDVVKAVFNEYSSYANIRFEFRQDDDVDACIRISFDGDENWSSLGRNALEVKEGPTMKLGGIHPYGLNRTLVLHYVGHSLGLEHDWYASFNEFNDTSIMESPGNDKEGASANAILSDADISWLLINYHGKSGVADWNLDKAFKTLNIPLEPASRAEPRRTFAEFLSRNSQDALLGLMRSANLAKDESQDLLYAVVMHPKFRQGIVNIVEYMIHSTSPELHFPEVNIRRFIWELLTGGIVGNRICRKHDIPPDTFADISEFYPDEQRKILQEMIDLAYLDASALPAEIQEGITITWGRRKGKGRRGRGGKK